MREGDWTQRWIADRSKVQLKDCVLVQRTRVVQSHGHDEIVRVLRVRQRLSERRFSGLEQFGVAASGNRRRIEAEHQLEHEAAAAYVMTRAEHSPVRGIKFVAPTRPGLLRVDEECLPHEHEIPTIRAAHQHRHGPRLGVHARSGREIHEESARAARAAHVHVRHVMGFLSDRDRHSKQTREMSAKHTPLLWLELKKARRF